MSPEQAKAKTVDRRADIWAFGCVLYEMLTGKVAFPGESVTDTLAGVIRAEPDWSLLPSSTPMRVRVLLQRCLQKDPKQRLRDIGDARISLDEILAGGPEQGLTGPPQTALPLWRRALPWAVGLLAVAVAGFAGWSLKPSPASVRPVTRTVITLPPGQGLAALGQPALALSADGSQLAYVATTQGSDIRQIYLRALDSLEARPVPGTEGATNPFFSPDGKWLGFFANAKLKKISVNGGVAQTLADAINPQGASWGSRGTIVFEPQSINPLQQLSGTGGVPQQVTRLETGENTHAWPNILPGTPAVLFVAEPSQTLALQLIGKDERRSLNIGQATMPHYVSSGHLIYAQVGNLMAVPFDLEKLQVRGAGVPVVQGVMQTVTNGSTQYSISATGSLVYVPGGAQATQSKLVWVSRNGAEQSLGAAARAYEQPRLSPDGRRVALDVVESGGTQSTQVWLYDLARDTLSRFTFEGPFNGYAVWTPDGKRIAFMSNTHGLQSIYWQRADGSGGLERLTAGNLDVPFSWSPDGKRMAFVNAVANPEIWVMQMGDRKAEPVLRTATFQDAPQFSPDGRWLAYASDESGRREIYVQPYPGPGGKWLVSTDGGTEPVWNRNGRELFYRSGNKMMAVEIGTQPNFTAGKPWQLFERSYLPNPLGLARANYDVSPDGQRFLMLKPVEQEQVAPAQIVLVQNWFEELKRLVPTGTK